MALERLTPLIYSLGSVEINLGCSNRSIVVLLCDLTKRFVCGVHILIYMCHS